MKTTHRILSLVFLAVLLVGAYAVTYTKQNARVARIQIDPTYANGSGTVATAPVSAYLETVLVNDADATDVLERGVNWKAVNFDLVDPSLAATNITAGGKTVTYPQLAALIRQACLDRANAAGIQ